jgi:hypothetical protein
MQHSLLAQLLARDPRKAVRFPDVPLEQALAVLQQMETAVQELKAMPPPAAPPPEPLGSMPPVVPVPAAEGLESLDGSLAGLATQVWRARNRIIDPETGEPREEMRRVYRHIEGALEMFAEMGLTMNDWLKQPYDTGLPVKVLTFQPTPDVQRDTVLEAIRPTIIWKDRLLQMGEVIVATPQSIEEKSQ